MFLCNHYLKQNSFTPLRRMHHRPSGTSILADCVLNCKLQRSIWIKVTLESARYYMVKLIALNVLCYLYLVLKIHSLFTHYYIVCNGLRTRITLWVHPHSAVKVKGVISKARLLQQMFRSCLSCTFSKESFMGVYSAKRKS